MYLRHGVTVEQAIQGLSEIITESQQPRIGQPAELRLKLNTYLNWVYGAQIRLRSLSLTPNLRTRCSRARTGMSP